MFNKIFKLVIAALIVITAVWQFTEGNIGNGIFLLLLAGIFILFYYKNEIIILAFFKLRKQDFEGAKKWLDRIKDPHTALVRKQEGYYYYLNGLMLSQTDLKQAEKFLKKAIALGLNMDQDLAMAKLNLAGIAITKRRKIEATQLLSEVKRLDKNNMLKDQVVMMKQQLKRI
jgi:tetratricopeptide (TPR) repeat protein